MKSAPWANLREFSEPLVESITRQSNKLKIFVDIVEILYALLTL